MLSSLVPGAIFQTSGLNRKSTPTPPTTTPSQLEQRYKRDSFNGSQWPHDSPVSRVYDVANTSTSLIILNNKYGKGSTRLRGYYTGPSERFIDPNRHRGKSPRNLDDPDHYYQSPPTPRFKPAIQTGLDWSHIDSRLYESRPQTSQTRRNLSATPTTSERPRSRISLPPQRYFTEYSDLSLGETLYMWSIEKIYNVENLKRLKQEQYRKLLQQEAKKGNHDFPEYAKYLRYINNAPNRTYGTGTGTPRSGTPRSKSAFSNRTTSGRTSPTKPAEPKSESKSNKETTNTKEETDPPKRPHTSIPTTQTVEKNEQKQEPSKPAQPKQDKVSTQGQGSRSPSRSSRTSQQKLGSMRSLRSKGSSRPSSRASSVKSGHARDVNKTEKLEHHEGSDRPKSRAGRPSSDGPSKSKDVEGAAVKDVDRQTERHDKQDSLTDSTTSLDDKQDKMGSISSIGSKNSDTTVEHRQDKPISAEHKPDKPNTAKNATDDVKVHRIPSAVDVKDEIDEDEHVKKDNKTMNDTNEPDNQPNNDNNEMNNETIKSEQKEDSDQQPKEVEKTVKFSDVNNDFTNKTDEEKTEVQGVSENVNKSDDMKESENVGEIKPETTKNKLSRQDSFDEDDDRRRNRDLDQIEY